MHSQINQFLEYLQYERGYSVCTLSAYKNDLSQFKQFAFGSKKKINAKEIDESTIRSWIAFLMDHNYSPRSVNRKLNSLRSFFVFLHSNELVEVNPIKRIKELRISKPLPSFITNRDINNLLDSQEENSFEDIRNKTILEVFYATGIRCTELVQLKDRDIDFEANLIKVTGKGNKQRLIPFTEILKKTLQSYQLFRDKAIQNTKKLAFFVRRDGRSLNHNIIYYLVKKRLNGIPYLSQKGPHVLRHTFATGMLNNGANLIGIKELLGHSSLASTEIYTHVNFEKLKKSYLQAHPRGNK